MVDEGPTEVGSIIGYLIMDDSDWDAVIDQAGAKADALGKKNPTIRISVDGDASAIAQLGAVSAAEDRVSSSNAKMGKSASDAAGDFKPLLSAVALLGPTLVPLGIVGAAALGGLALGAGSLLLAYKGVNAEVAAGTPLGVAYAAGIKSITTDIDELEQSAARGVFQPFNDGIAEANVLMPTLNTEVGQFATVTGNGTVAIISGIVNGFITLRPLLQDVDLGFAHAGATFHTWESSTGGVTKFMATAQADMPIVTQDTLEIVGAVLKVGDAFGSTGLTALSVLGDTAKLINALPISVLDHLAEVVTIGFTAWKGYQILTFVKSGYDSVTTSIDKASTALSAQALQERAVETAQASLATSTAAVVAEESAVGAAAEAAALKEAGFGSAVEALAVSADKTSISLAANAAAAEAAATAEQAAADATEAAAVGMDAALGPIGLVAAGVGALAIAFLGSDSSSAKAKATMDSYTSAVQADTGAIGDNIKAKAAQALQTSGADTAAQALGISTTTLLQATLGNADAQAKVKAATDAATAALNAQAPAQGAGRAAINSTSESLDKQRAGIDLVISSVGQQSAGIKGAIDAYQQWNSALGANSTQLGTLSAANASLVTQQTAIATAYGLTADQASAYLQISGYVADTTLTNSQNADRYAVALQNVITQENAAGPAATALIAAMNAFATSEDTAADKAHLLGAVLVASQGDALSYAGALAAGYGADSALVSAFQSQAATLAQQAAQSAADASNTSSSTASARDKVTAANARLTAAEQKLQAAQTGSRSTEAQIAAAEAAVASAKSGVDSATTSLNNAATAATGAGLAFANTELGSIDLQTGLINLKSAGAGPLIQQLQAMQTAAQNAAEALYQHELSTQGDSQALQDAQDLFESMTGGTLVANAKQLGLTAAQATNLAKQYFNVPTDLTTDVQAVGLNDLNTTLNELGTELSHLTGVPWVSTLTADTSQYTSSMQAAIALMQSFQDTAAKRLAGPTAGPQATPPTQADININNKVSGQRLAAGGAMADGWGQVGENGPEWFFKSGSNVQIIPQDSNTTASVMQMLSAASGVKGPSSSSPVGVAAKSMANSSASAKMTPSKTIVLNQTINNPLAETVPTTTPAALRAASYALGSF